LAFILLSEDREAIHGGNVPPNRTIKLMIYQHVRRPFWRRHPVVTGAALLLAFWWLTNGWYEALAVTAIVGLFLFVRHRRRDLAHRDAGLRARADYEHRLILAGDPHGLYGRYPPVPLPPSVRLLHTNCGKAVQQPHIRRVSYSIGQ
jgi:hypothetical protein